MKVFSIVMAVVITAFVGIGNVFAGPQGPVPEQAGKNMSHGERGFLGMLEKLALNADQEKQIASVLGKHRDEIGKIIAGMVEARQSLREAIMADVYSEGSVRQEAQRVSEQEVQAAVLRARIANEIKPVLTAEQKEQLKHFANSRAGKVKDFVDSRLANLDKWIAAHAR